MIRIAIVNDVKMAVEVLRRIVLSLPDTEVAWIAEDGKEAVEKCQADTPDIVLMDLIMPVMDGVEATRRIMMQSPCPILVVTATISGNCNKVYESLGHGAVDAVNTPVLGRNGDIAGGDDLQRKIRNIVRLRCGGTGFQGSHHASRTPGRRSSGTPPIVAIGASTGGPQALATVLAGLSPPLNYSVVIIQHLDELFVPGLVEWLAYESKLPVQQIESGHPPMIGTISVACTPDHLVLTSAGVYQYIPEPAGHVHRPSIDVLFDSLASAGVQCGTAVLLTGMGRDGAVGMKTLKDSGWKTVAQDKQSSIVWGMPGAAVQLGAAEQVLPLDQIGPAISELMTPKKV